MTSALWIPDLLCLKHISGNVGKHPPVTIPRQHDKRTSYDLEGYLVSLAAGHNLTGENRGIESISFQETITHNSLRMGTETGERESRAG